MERWRQPGLRPPEALPTGPRVEGRGRGSLGTTLDSLWAAPRGTLDFHGAAWWQSLLPTERSPSRLDSVEAPCSGQQGPRKASRDPRVFCSRRGRGGAARWAMHATAGRGGHGPQGKPPLSSKKNQPQGLTHVPGPHLHLRNALGGRPAGPLLTALRRKEGSLGGSSCSAGPGWVASALRQEECHTPTVTDLAPASAHPSAMHSCSEQVWRPEAPPLGGL